MRFHYVASVAAAAFVMSAEGLQIAPDSAETIYVQTVTETRSQPGKTERFLIDEPMNAGPKKPTGYGFSALRGKDDFRLRQGVKGYKDKGDNPSAYYLNDEERFFGKKKKKKKRHHEHEETEAPASSGSASAEEEAEAEEAEEAEEEDDDNWLIDILRDKVGA